MAASDMPPPPRSAIARAADRIKKERREKAAAAAATDGEAAEPDDAATEKEANAAVVIGQIVSRYRRAWDAIAGACEDYEQLCEEAWEAGGADTAAYGSEGDERQQGVETTDRGMPVVAFGEGAVYLKARQERSAAPQRTPEQKAEDRAAEQRKLEEERHARRSATLTHMSRFAIRQFRGDKVLGERYRRRALPARCGAS